MDQFIEEVARCPVTQGPLRPLTAAEIEAANADGAVEPQLTAGAVTIDGRIAYRLDGGILELLADRAIPLEPSEVTAPPAKSLRSEKESVQAFYDEVGWTKGDDDLFEDTARFVDTRPEVEAYNRLSMERVNRYLEPRGKYFLDVASGPVQFPEYVAYSRSFDHRICMDFSALALATAREKLGDHGIYVLGDITNLPLADDSLDGVISLHTIYHVPREEQPAAFRELYRVLKPGATAVVAYTWGRTEWAELDAARKVLLFPSRVVQRLARSFGSSSGGEEHVEDGLYFHAFDHHWFVRQPWPFEYEIVVSHALTSEFMKRWVRGRLGRGVLVATAALEERFPRLTGRFGRYPLIVIKK